MGYGPMEVAIALALYDHNVSPVARAKRLEQSLPTEGLSTQQVCRVLQADAVSFALRLDPIVAETYMHFALKEYGEEAKRRVKESGMGKSHGIKETEQDIPGTA